MAIFKCKMCGGNLEITDGMTVCECEYCGTKQTLPRSDSDQKLNMINRANHFRQQCEFDKAMEIYERLLSQDDSDAEIYWSIVLCKYGIEYVDDPLTNKKIPTCHRTQYTLILQDADYLEAVAHADIEQKAVYTAEAEYIAEVQKGILEISNKEDPFDVFICYKESDENGKRTPDSVLAQDLYYQLEREGFKVFFSRITLEGKLGTTYEPYIFAALNSSKVMVVVGTKPEYFNAVWVKNEWSRFLMLMKNDHGKTLIPAYKDMDPYDMPDALSMFQAQDMSKLGFMQDLIRGISKLAGENTHEHAPASRPEYTAAPVNPKIENLLRRGMLSLEDKKWADADNFFEGVLNENVEEPRAYLGKLLVELKLSFEKDLLTLDADITKSDMYKKAVRFGDDSFKKKMEEYNQKTIENMLKKVYENAVNTMNDAAAGKDHVKFKFAASLFSSISDYGDSSEKAAECVKQAEFYEECERKYLSAMSMINRGRVEDMQPAFDLLEGIVDYRDSRSIIERVKKRFEASIRKKEYEERDEIFAQKRRALLAENEKLGFFDKKRKDEIAAELKKIAKERDRLKEEYADALK